MNPHSNDEVHVPRFVGVVLILLPAVLVAAGLFIGDKFSAYDPTTNFFKGLLNASPATNPIANYAPFRDDGAFVYAASTQELSVRTAMSGKITQAHDRFLELKGVNIAGQPVIVRYSGLTTTAKASEETIPYGTTIGTIDGTMIMQVRFIVDKQQKLLPESIPLLPRSFKHNKASKSE